MKTPLRPEAVSQIVDRLTDRDGGRERLFEVLTRGIKPTVRGRYRHWDSLRHLEPPGDLTSQEWWLAIKMARRNVLYDLPHLATDGTPFQYALVPPILEMLRRVDQEASGQIAVSESVVTPDTQRRFLVRSLVEEAITSSQLEGAGTTRPVAKEMLRTGRPPADRDERMILNNYRAMEFVRDRVDRDLSPAVVLELHRVLTEETLDEPSAAGRLQRPDEERITVTDEQGTVLHQPPPAGELPARLRALCAFANGETGRDSYLHPVIRAIVVHFWLGYDHPFEDGNGRTARALFYWTMLRQGYWLTEYLTISRILKEGRANYIRAFLYSEWDDNDLTYFLLHQLKVIIRAIEELHAYLRRKMREVRETEALLQAADLNNRQVALLGHALRHPHADYTFKSHARSHGVVYQSARTDLLDLEERGLLTRRQVGRTYHFRPAPDLPDRIEGAAPVGT